MDIPQVRLSHGKAKGFSPEDNIIRSEDTSMVEIVSRPNVRLSKPGTVLVDHGEGSIREEWAYRGMVRTLIICICSITHLIDVFS